MQIINLNRPLTLTAEQEESLASFLAVVESDPDFVLVTTRKKNPACGVWLNINGKRTDLPCLAAAQDDLGNWTTLDEQCRVRQFLAHEVE